MCSLLPPLILYRTLVLISARTLCESDPTLKYKNALKNVLEKYQNKYLHCSLILIIHSAWVQETGGKLRISKY
jgi:hypothetical protein